MNQDEILIAFGVDAGYVQHMAVTIASILSNSPGAKFRFLIINDGIDDTDKKKIEALAPGHAFQWPMVTDERVMKLGRKHHISRAAFYRLSIPEFAPADAQRAIYVDSDIVVLGDIRELWKTELNAHPIAAVYDIGMDSEAFARKWGLPPARLNYFNSGVLVLDLAKIRSDQAFDPAYNIIESRWEDAEYMDQCVLNAMFWNNWQRLDPIWNFQRNMIIPKPGQPLYAEPEDLPVNRRPKLIHYTEQNKPWSVDAYHPLTWMYYRYLRKTPYWQDVNSKAKTSWFKHLRRFIKQQLTLSRLREA
ncbi:MAG: glycosyltransferase family 8 protein [Hyphomonas sp.]|uniref:glycosyltransferase family 8 protein n=1 Tax=Hyphomonas sp. TaxID=87 RepID=UPI0035295519